MLDSLICHWGRKHKDLTRGTYWGYPNSSNSSPYELVAFVSHPDCCWSECSINYHRRFSSPWFAVLRFEWGVSGNTHWPVRCIIRSLMGKKPPEVDHIDRNPSFHKKHFTNWSQLGRKRTLLMEMIWRVASHDVGECGSELFITQSCTALVLLIQLARKPGRVCAWLKQ